MILTKDMYVPALRWRQGEYQALAGLAAAAKARTVPYVTIPEVEFDFELQQAKKTLQEHVHPFAARFNVKWGQRPAWVGVHPSISRKSMGDRRDIFTYVFEALRAFRANAMPVVPLDASPPIVASVAGIVATDGVGSVIAVRLEDLMKPDARTRIEALTASLGLLLGEVDLVIDLGAPNFEPYNAFAGALIAAMRKLGDLHAFRNFVVIGTAIPETFKDVA
ncbi:MAG: beta family protein, partial [Bradyrhizobium sp.]